LNIQSPANETDFTAGGSRVNHQQTNGSGVQSTQKQTILPEPATANYDSQRIYDQGEQSSDDGALPADNQFNLRLRPTQETDGYEHVPQQA
jgi:hypothetical protein